MNKADFGALKCQAACSTGIYIFCPSNRKGDIAFERIKLTANSIYSLKSSAVAHANTLWSRVAAAIQQKKRGYDPGVVLTKVFSKTYCQCQECGALGIWDIFLRWWEGTELLWVLGKEIMSGNTFGSQKCFKKSLLLFSFLFVVHSHPFLLRRLGF